MGCGSGVGTRLEFVLSLSESRLYFETNVNHTPKNLTSYNIASFIILHNLGTGRVPRMNTVLLLITCVLAILISIVSVQLPRYLQYHKGKTTSSKGGKHGSRQRMIDGFNTSSQIKPSRKPWDPPFPTKPKQESKEKGWLILPPSPLSKTTVPGDGAAEEEREKMGSDTKQHREVQDDQQVTGNLADMGEPTSPMSIVWTFIAVLAGIFLILSFALLIAHCLAWFIVYKTEARLGEARRGLVHGGEMRLCLCARG
jgi:hypothetical protein